ncbi:MAG: recombinase family protein [Candidatus Thioglobus autotrophicus]|nr:recombinase family protein [Candidatus Thioglobus autotrophicus]
MKKHIERMVKSYEDDELGYTLDDAVLDVAVYVRVSTSGQTTENQLIELSEVCERNKWHITNVYNETVSGTKGVDERAELNRMMQDASRKQFSKVVVWSVDRVGRSMKHLVNVLSQLKDLGCDIYSYKQAIDTSTTMGSSFFHMVGIFAELENNMRAERQKIGIKRALSQGVKFGRKDVIDEDKELAIVELRHKGKSIRYIANKIGISVGRTHQVCSSMSM